MMPFVPVALTRFAPVSATPFAPPAVTPFAPVAVTPLAPAGGTPFAPIGLFAVTGGDGAGTAAGTGAGRVASRIATPQTHAVTTAPTNTSRGRIRETNGFGTRLADEIGSQNGGARPQGRTLFGTSGRAQAWVGAIHIGAERPITGYGFGTEDFVFVDRWYNFQGNRPENSYIGMFMQLGLVGLALLCSIGVALIFAARKVLRSTGDRALGAACFGAVAAGATLAIVQSYIYAVGDIGTVAFWTTAFVMAGLAGPAVVRAR